MFQIPEFQMKGAHGRPQDQVMISMIMKHSYPPFSGYQYSETMGCHQKSPTDYYGDINYDEFPNGSDIMGVHMASKSSKKVTFEFVLKLLSFSSDI